MKKIKLTTSSDPAGITGLILVDNDGKVFDVLFFSTSFDCEEAARLACFIPDDFKAPDGALTIDEFITKYGLRDSACGVKSDTKLH